MATIATRDLRAALARYSLRAVRDLLFAARYSLFALFVFCLPLAAQTPQEVQRTTEQVIRKLDLQTTLPREPERPRFSIPLPAEALWVVVVIALGVLLYAFRDYIPLFGRGQGAALGRRRTAARPARRRWCWLRRTTWPRRAGSSKRCTCCCCRA